MNDFISIVILQFNNSHYTIALLNSLEKIKYKKFRIVIVDNHSTDSSVKHLKNHFKKNNHSFSYIIDDKNGKFKNIEKPFSKIFLVKSLKNGGYAYGCNLGLKLSLSLQSDYYLILNNDVEVDPNFLNELIVFSKRNPEMGMISSKIFYYGTKDLVWFNGGKINRLTGRVTHFNFRKKDNPELEYKGINFLTGCSLFIPHEPLIDVGFLDEAFFFYHEDVDYSLQFLKKGYQLGVCSNSIIYHKKNISGIDISDTGAKYRSINKKLLINKHFKGLSKIFAHADHLFYAFLKYIYNGKYRLAFEHIFAVLTKKK